MKAIPKIARTDAAFVQTAQPAALARLGEDRLVELDVREELRAGREPFSLIMAAVRDVRADEALVLRATFEPAPLYAVLGRQDFSHWTERLADDDWRVTFYRASAEADENDAVEDGVVEDGIVDDDVVVLDVRDLEPPEPMVRTLEALETLPQSKTLLQINVRVPMFLLPILEERGFTYQINEQQAGVVRIFIKHGKVK